MIGKNIVQYLATLFPRLHHTNTFDGDLLRSSGGTQDVGTVGTPWDNGYFTTVTAGTVVGTLTGSEWETAGNATIDAHLVSDHTTVYVVNQDATYQADLNVERNIIVGGTVDGIDLLAHGSRHDPTGADAVTTAVAGAIQPDDTAAEGNAASLARSNHTHGFVCAAPAANLSVSTSNAEGDAVTSARSNHSHAITSSSAPGAAASILASDASGHLRVEGLGIGVAATAGQVSLATGGAIGIAGNELLTVNAAGTFGFSGITGITVEDEDWIGIGAAAERIVFDTAGDIAVLGARLGVGVVAVDAAVKIQETALDHLCFTRGVANEYVSYNMSSDTLLETDIHNEAADVYWRIYNESNDPQTSYRVFVGLNCNGDPQFDLDIAGNLRAQGWIVGKHAIQLEGALAIFHYDGPEPFETNYAGTCTGHMGQVGTTSGGVIFRPGKFQKGVQIAEATTNLCRNPSYELTGEWANVAGCTLSQSSLGVVYGDYSLKVIHAATNDRFQDVVTADTSAATQYTFSVYASGDSGGEEIKLAFYDDVTAYQFSGLITLTTTPTRYTITKTFGVASTSRTVGIISVDSGSITVYYDGFQLEQKAYATPYCDGSLGLIADGAWRDGEPGTEGHYWNGTAHASTSSRTAAALQYSTSGNLNLSEGTIMFWLPNLTHWSASKEQWFFVHSSGANLISVYKGTDNWLRFYVSTDGVAAFDSTGWSAGDTHHVAVSWDAAGTYIYIDGAYVGKDTSFTLPTTLASTFFVGCNTASAAQADMVIDELAIVDHCLKNSSDDESDEIRAIYESEAPVFAESSTFQFSAGPSQLIWADHEGMWARTDDGGAALGLFCGTGTKGWGGFTMGPADLVLGANVTGSAAIHWDQSTGKFGFYGDANATVQVEIDTDGSLLAGAGAAVLNASGVALTGTSFANSMLKFVDGSTEARVYYGGGSLHLSNEDPSNVSGVAFFSVDGYDGADWNNVLVGIRNHPSFSAWGFTVSNFKSDGQLHVTADARIGGGLYVGSVATDADDNDIWVVNDVRIGGGLYVGSVATDPPVDTIIVDSAIGVGITAPPEAVSIKHDGKLAFCYSAGAPNTTYNRIYRDAANDNCMRFEYYPTTSTTATAFLFYGSASAGVPDKALVSILNSGNVGIAQGADDGNILTFASTDVSHGMTALAASSVYGMFLKTEATSGGLTVIGAKDSAGVAGQALQLVGALGETAADTTKTTAAIGVVHTASWIQNATSIKPCGTNENLVVFANGTTARFIFDAEGSAHADVEWVAFDEYDDVALLSDLETAMVAQRDPVKSEFVEFLKYNHDALEEAGVVHFDRDNPGHAMVNTTKLSQLLVGALQQVSSRIDRLEERLNVV